MGLATWEICQSCCSRLHQFIFLYQIIVVLHHTAPASETRCFAPDSFKLQGFVQLLLASRGGPDFVGQLLSIIGAVRLNSRWRIVPVNHFCEAIQCFEICSNSRTQNIWGRTCQVIRISSLCHVQQLPVWHMLTSSDIC